MKAHRALSSFDDVYFSRAGGLAESEAVFLTGCGLARTLGECRSICHLRAWFRHGTECFGGVARVEKRPDYLMRFCISSRSKHSLSQGQDAARALVHFPEVGDLVEQLLARWPVRAYAPQRLWFADDGFALTLLTGEAETSCAA